MNEHSVATGRDGSRPSSGPSGGFSLVELMVAMTVTLIVSGAIYGLLTSGSNAFRREPEVADRQQNIRMAMDLISRDVFNAGAALPTFSQVFTRIDPAGGTCTGATGLNGCGPAGTMGPTEAAGRAPGDGGDPSQNSDVVEIVSVDERCPAQTVCSTATPPGTAGDFATREGVPACLTLPGLVLLTDNTSFTVQPAAAASSGAACDTGGNTARNGALTLTDFLQPWVGPVVAPNPNPPPAMPVVFLYRAQVVRYRIAPSTDPQDSAPALWRSESGLYTSTGGAAGAPGAGAPWELVARGIEDLQLEYSYGVPATWHNQPPVSTTGDWNSLVREVRISLSARVTAANLQGQTRAAGGGAPDAVRGQLSSTVAPRAAFHELQMCLAHPTNPCPQASHIQ
jgi:prepilin-type N-terminal cleavage/methylation domain-containing protein